MKTLIIILTALLLLGCASPYQGQLDGLNAAYQRGDISASDYQARVNELIALDLQRRQAISNAFFTSSSYFQNQQYLNQMRQPQTIYLYNRY